MQIKYFVLLIFSLTLAVKSEVQDGFKKIGEKFYYIDDRIRFSWYNALKKCQEKGGHLASLQNANELELLEAHLNIDKRYWIDLNDIRNEGEFISETTCKEAPYVKWLPSYNPDNKWDLENCVILWYRDNQFGMNDAKCTYEINFVCEKELNDNV